MTVVQTDVPAVDQFTDSRSSNGTPKIRIHKEVVDVGTMIVGEQKCCDFEISNDGDAVLLLEKGTVDCSCVDFEIDHPTVVPGGHAIVRVNWRAIREMDAFDQSVRVKTNDPQSQSVALRVTGSISKLVVVRPNDYWVLGGLDGSRDVRAFGAIVSQRLADFQCTAVEVSSPSESHCCGA